MPAFPKNFINLQTARRVALSFPVRERTAPRVGKPACTLNFGKTPQNNHMQPSAERLEIEQLDDSGIPAWDAYVDGKADAVLYHSARWLTVIDAFDHECYFFQAKRDGAIGVVCR